MSSGPLRTIDDFCSWEKRTAFLLESEETEDRSSLESAEMLSIKLVGLVMIPHSVAIAWAVSAKSPVTCRR